MRCRLRRNCVGGDDGKDRYGFLPFGRRLHDQRNGHTFMLHVKRPTGGDLLLGFPHSEICQLVEHAAVQAAHGRDAKGQKTATALKISSFKVSRGPDGVTMVVGQAGTISFLLPGDMAGHNDGGQEATSSNVRFA